MIATLARRRLFRTLLLAWLALALVLVLVLALAGPAMGSRAAVADGEPRGPFVGGIVWRGNRALAKSALQAVTFTHPPSWRIWKPDPEFSESTLAGDMDRIRALYKLYGYYETQAHFSLVWNEKHDRVKVTISIEEGPWVEMRRRSIALPPQLDLDTKSRPALLADLPLQIDSIFSARRYAQARDLLLDRLADVGYPLARIEGGATVDVHTHEAVVDWKVVPGPVVHFGAITTHGLYLIDEETVQREIRIAPGDRYSTGALLAVRRGLQSQGLYSWVSVQAAPPEPAAERTPKSASDANSETTSAEDSGHRPLPSDSAIWPVEVRLTERPPYTIDFGVGYGTDEDFRASLGWRHGDFLGDARKLRLSALYSGILSKLEVEFTQPYFFDPKLSLIFKTSIRRETEPSFTANRFLPSIGLTRPLGGPWIARLNYEFSYNDVIRTSGDAAAVLDEPIGVSRVSGLEFALRRQTLDDLLDPRRGSWLDFSVRPSLYELGSQFDYLTLLVEGRGFYNIWQGTILAARLRLGAIQPLRATRADSIPVIDRFFAGGSSSFRGFQYHRLPPTGSDRSSVGGTSLIESSLEWRLPIWSKFGAVLFVDAAQLDLDPFRYQFDSLFWAVGPGLRYDTIVGPLRFDLGVLLNPPAGQSSRVQWFLSVGHSF